MASAASFKKGVSLALKAILFDHDGTLVDSEGSHFRMWLEVLESFGVTLSEQDYQKYYAGMPTPANAIRLIQQFDLTTSADQLIEEKYQANRAFLSKAAFPLMPGARESIQRFHGLGLKLAIVTGAGREGTDATIITYSLDRYLSTSVCSEDVIHSKPSPDCYLLAIKRLGVSANECIAIEDTEHGVRAATSAGIPCMAIPTEMSRHHDFSLARNKFIDVSAATKWVIDQYSL